MITVSTCIDQHSFSNAHLFIVVALSLLTDLQACSFSTNTTLLFKDISLHLVTKLIYSSCRTVINVLEHTIPLYM